MPEGTASKPSDVTPLRLVAACALLLTSAAGLPADAAPAGVLTVRGSTSAYVDVTFPARFRLHTDMFETKTPPRVSTSGTFAGVWLDRIGGDEATGAVEMAGLPAWSGMPIGLGGTGWLPAGSYRVYLLADGPTTVRINADGLRDTTLTPERRADVKGRLVRRTAAGLDAPADRTTVPVNVRGGTLTVLASSQASTGVAGDQRICLHPPGEPGRPCELGGGSGGGFTVFGAPGEFGIGSAVVFYPGTSKAGEHVAEFVDVSAGAPGGMYAFALTVN